MIAVSILDINENNEIIKFNNLNVDYIHLDIMDGIFVKNKTCSILEDKQRLQNVNKKIDVHLMVEDVKKYIDEYKIFNPEFITFHIEATNNIKEIIDYIKSLNIKVGLSIKPDTNVDEITSYLNDIDLVLVMTVEPGMGGQKFIPSMIDKVEKLKQIKQNNNYSYLIEVDGGINNETIKLIDSDIYVVGSYITKSDDYQKMLDELFN